MNPLWRLLQALGGGQQTQPVPAPKNALAPRPEVPEDWEAYRNQVAEETASPMDRFVEGYAEVEDQTRAGTMDAATAERQRQFLLRRLLQPELVAKFPDS